MEKETDKKEVGSVLGSDGISKGEWLSRCAARFIKVAGISEGVAEQFAETCLESTLEFYDSESTPEECADNEMSYWRD